MKKINLLLMSLVALFMACFTACESKYDVDHTAHIVGTWTYIGPNYAEALVIKEDGSVLSTGIENGEYWENVAGTIKIKGNVATMTFEDGDDAIGHIDVIPGIAFSIYEEDGEKWTFNYCKEDLSDEILGMWVCNDGLTDGVTVMSYSDNGKCTITTATALGTDDPLVKQESEYVVAGDLIFMELPAANASGFTAAHMTYAPNGTSLGDIMTHKKYVPSENGLTESVMSFLRIKQTLDLPGNQYDYMKTFVTNVKGEDKDIPFLNTSFNFAKMDGSIIDKFLKSILFTVEFPEANKIKYSYLLEGQNIVIEAPILVEGNKMTIKMSAINPAYLDVDMYAFQDQDNTQMHWYMHTTSFEKFFANTSVALMLGYGQLDKNDTEAIANVYKTIADAVHSINLSLVMTKTAK